MPINIHGKQYVTVHERIQAAHDDNDTLSITTEIIPNTDMVLMKATVTTRKGTFTGYSAANANKAIEKQSPYEVAETSAIGRALGFAGYGITEGVATADEIRKVENDFMINEFQREKIKELSAQLNKQAPSNEELNKMSREEARELVKQLKQLMKEAQV